MLRSLQTANSAPKSITLCAATTNCFSASRFHQAPRKNGKISPSFSPLRWFRGKVTSVTASDPSATRDPFTLDYEITVPKFADWSKKPVRIPALLPQMACRSARKPSPGAAASPIELGTPSRSKHI